MSLTPDVMTCLLMEPRHAKPLRLIQPFLPDEKNRDRDLMQQRCQYKNLNDKNYQYKNRQHNNRQHKEHSVMKNMDAGLVSASHPVVFSAIHQSSQSLEFQSNECQCNECKSGLYPYCFSQKLISQKSVSIPSFVKASFFKSPFSQCLNQHLPLQNTQHMPHLKNAHFVSPQLQDTNLLNTKPQGAKYQKRLQGEAIRPSQAGFTLVEIMVVVIILSVFAGMMSLSVGSSESRKNRAYYEHLQDSLSYVRLLSAERMQPMGLVLKANTQGQVQPTIVMLTNPYQSYESQAQNAQDARAKNAMELSAMSRSEDENTQPSWEVDPSVSLPEMPEGVSLTIAQLDGQVEANGGRALQPWFAGQEVPQVLWYGTGQATPVSIEVRHDNRLVGEAMTVLPNGSVQVGQP